MVEIFHRGERVASHPRSSMPRRFTTTREHRPKSHQRYLDWTPSRVIEWVGKIGPATMEVATRILAANSHPEQGYRSCLGLIRLTNDYTAERVEAAAQRAVIANACTYQSVKSILKNNLDGQPVALPTEPTPPIDHPNVRGPGYFDGGANPLK
jgi:transposase